MKLPFYYLTTYVYRYYDDRPSTEEAHIKKFETFDKFKEEWDRALQYFNNRDDLELESTLSYGYCFRTKDTKSPEYMTICLVNCGLKFDK